MEEPFEYVLTTSFKEVPYRQHSCAFFQFEAAAMFYRVLKTDIPIVFCIDAIEVGGGCPFTHTHTREVGHLKKPIAVKGVDVLSIYANRIVRFCRPEVVPGRRIRSIDVSARIDKPYVTVRPVFEAEDVIVRMCSEPAHPYGGCRDMDISIVATQNEKALIAITC